MNESPLKSGPPAAGSRFRIDLPKIMLLGILVFTVGFFTAMNPRFFSWRSFIFVLIQNSFVIVSGCAVTLLMIAGTSTFRSGAPSCCPA